MAGLKPFWRYYGGKWRAAPRYPEPDHRVIVEPFAGAAGYSLRYPDQRVVLVEKYPTIAEMWRYLIKALPSEIRRIAEVQHVEDLPRWVPQGARSLVGFAMNSGASAPCKMLSAGRLKMRSMGRALEGWTPKLRGRVASQVEFIRHWKIIEGDYTRAPDVSATWFVDAPYSNEAGRHYIHHQVDYAELASWCRSRRGQVLVCEQEGATWAPFRPFETSKAAMGRNSREALWQIPAENRGDSLGTCIGSRPGLKIPVTMVTKKSDLLIEEFLGHISKLADNLRAAVIAEAHEAFSNLAGGGTVGNGLRANPGSKPKGSKAASKSKGGRNRRSPEDLEKQSTQILQFIRKNQGSKAIAIGKALGLSTQEIALPISKMLLEGTLKSKGIKAGTTYTVPK